MKRFVFLVYIIIAVFYWFSLMGKFGTGMKAYLFGRALTWPFQLLGWIF
ncbi:hypothetical protein [Acinetobacter populi]|nr:hypothetical protein [Acinetobacter populi]